MASRSDSRRTQLVLAQKLASGAADAAGRLAAAADAAEATAAALGAAARRDQAAAASARAAARSLAAAYAKELARKTLTVLKTVGKKLASTAAALGKTLAKGAVVLAQAAYKYSGAQSIVSCVTNPSLSSCVQAAITVALVVGTAGSGEVADVAAEGVIDLAEDAGADAAEEGAEGAGRSAAEDAAESCETAGGESFTASTKVLLADRVAIPISKLRTSDKVLATNVRTGKTSAETVKAVLLHHDTDRYDMRVKAAQGSAVIHTTSNHLFWNAATHHWVKADTLGHGSYLRGPGGGKILVLRDYTPADLSGWMWNLTVADDHDFYLQAGGVHVLVHNCPTAGEGSPKVSDVLKTKLGSIMRAPLPKGSPAWGDIGDMTLDEVRAAARANQPGFKTILKLLNDGRFNR